MHLKIKTLIVDDSSLVREAVKDILKRNLDDLVFLEDARDGQEGLERIMRARPDLVILDVEMPRKNGIELLKELRRRRIYPAILMLSHLTREGATTTFEALELGALDFVPKPAAGGGISLSEIESLLVTRVQGLVDTVRDITELNPRPIHEAPGKRKYETTQYEIVFFGASTGGPQALMEIIKKIPSNFKLPVFIVQHMPPVFTRTFAERLDKVSPLRVVEAENGMAVQGGTIYIAPGSRHMVLNKGVHGATIEINENAPRNAHRPSIDVTLESLILAYGSRVAAVLMTGMGRDGVSSMKLLYDNGGVTIAQDEDTSVVFGMNRRAIESGSIIRVAPLKNIVEVLLSYLRD